MQVESLGRYRIEKELGSGAMGRVFLAYDPQIDRRVAIKTIQIFAALPAAEREAARERFLREARSAGKLLHPGIVTIFDVGDTDGVPYLAMEFVEGQTLDAYCRGDALLPVPGVVALLAASAEALGFAHERGIVHRDIKPANLMRVGTRAVKIMDFGLAKSAATSMTHDGALFGTPNYMSPEQVRGETLDGRSDLFSLAVVAYEMLTGVKPFGGDSISSVLYRIVNEPPKDASLNLERVPAPLAAFLHRALAKKPEDRFRDGAAFAAALRRAGGLVSGEVAADPPVSPSPLPKPSGVPIADSVAEPRKRSLLPWIVGGVLALAALAWGGLTMFGPAAPQPRSLLEARVRTEPAGLPVFLNGKPVDGDRVPFSADGPFGVLTAVQGCREAKHRVEVADAGREIVLVLDAERADVLVDPGVAGAKVTLNGTDAGSAPATLAVDLCRENAIAVEAPGYRSALITIPARAMPLEARNAAAGVKLDIIPIGRVNLPATRFPVVFTIDGAPVTRRAEGIEIAAGSHVVRATNDERFVDVSATIDVPAGGAMAPELAFPAVAQLFVQTFPPNCRVALKTAGSAWRPVGETPLHYELASGRYALRVESPQTTDSREQEIVLRPGANAPVRVSFGKLGR
jgi:serine/threonine-protein kinase